MVGALAIMRARRSYVWTIYACSTWAATFQGTGLSKPFLTIAAAFTEAERDHIRERIGQVKAAQKARGRYLGGKVPFGFRRGESGELVPDKAEQEAIREIVALRAQGKPLRAIADVMQAKGPIGSATRAWRAF
jgi:DNA invertase Pin-like site-specific DNA recombinase